MRRILASPFVPALAAALLVLATPAAGAPLPDHAAVQDEPQAEAEAAPAAPAAPATLLDEVAADMERVSGRLIALAEAIPADKYGWSLTPEVRTVSEVFVHVVGTNLLLPPVLGAAPPEGVEMDGSPFATMAKWEAEVTSKEAVVAKLQESYAYAIDAIRNLDPATLEDQIALFGPPSSKRSYALILMNHGHEHLGQAIAYTRALGITPPWSQVQDED